MSWFKGLFGGKSDGSQAVVPLTDREYEQLFLQVLQGVAANWDEQRLLKLLGDRCGDRQMVVWLRGYGDRLLGEPANPDLAGLLVRLGEIGCGELGMVAQGIGLEMGNIPVERVISEVKTREVSDVKPSNAEIPYKEDLEEVQVCEYQKTLDYIDLAISINPNNAHEILNRKEHEIWFLRGLSLYSLGRFEEAIISLNQAIDINPDDYSAWNVRGVSLNEVGRDEEALVSYECAININPDANNWSNKGSSLEKLGRYEESIAAYNNAISINPEYAMAWRGKGVSLQKLGSHEEAITFFDLAISINPDYDDAWFGKGCSLFCLGKYEEAIAMFDRTISINPDYDLALNNKGYSLIILGRYEEAIKSFDHSININKANAYMAWCNKGNALKELGKYEEAISHYDRAITITRGNIWRAWIVRGNAALKSDGKGKELLLKVFGQSLPPDMQNLILDKRGYEGEIASCNEGLKYINQATEPEGWGQIHHYIGKAHYSHGKKQKNPFSFYQQAILSYETALQTLTAVKQFETSHLETLQDYIRVLLALRETEKAAGLLRKGTDFLEARLKEKSGGNRERFEKQFRPYFNELTVGLYIQQGKRTEALEIAEKDKNAFLRDGLLADTTEPSPDYSQMCAFLNQKTNTAIIYWHLSDNALTTFILAPNALSEITLNLLPTPTTENATLTQRNQLTDWMTAWKNDYADYGGKKTKSEPQEAKPEAKGENHPWRVQMEARLVNLKNILRITDIETTLADSPHCTQLLLIPHRDLHLYPLDSLFDSKYSIAYLPSIQVGIKLLDRPKPTYKRLLSIENPDSSITLEDGSKQNLPKLTAAESESELICRIYGESTRRAKAETTLAEVTAQLTDTTPQPHTIFHFTGHGYYDFLSPIDSALALSGSDRLTLKAIGNLDLSSYQLACLCACETAIAGNQTITKEYIGIVSAFMYSGVANVVSTLWTVESISSALLMIEFHRRYVAGESAEVALAAAKHWLRNATNEDLRKWYEQQINKLPDNHSLRSWLYDRLDELSASTDSQPYSHPYHWSAFTITGL